MITVLAGTNAFLLRRRLDELISRFVEDSGELALERFDAEEAEARTIIDAIFNLPFLSPRKMVVVKSSHKNRELSEQFEQIVDSIPEWCELILYEPNIDKRTAYFKLLKNRTIFKEFTELDSRGLANWLVEEAQKAGGQLKTGDAFYMIERLGPNQLLLFNELQKLLIYDAQINRQNIELLIEHSPQSKVFDLLDAAFSGQKQRALKLYDEQRAQKLEPPAILAMLVWQLNLIALAKAGKGISSTQITRDSGTSDFPVQKAQRLASNLSESDINRLIEEAYQIDLDSKTSPLDMDEALKTYLSLA